VTVLRESAAIWRKLGLARGILYSAYDILKGDKRKDAIQLRKEIEGVLNATASDPPSDLDLDAYEKGKIVACAPRVRTRKKR
jgi:hypothetical protein